MAGTLFRLFVILLGLSHLVCLKAVPITRTESLMQGPQVHPALDNIHKVIAERKWDWEEEEEELTVSERMDLELLRDYQPPGANNRHTPPKAP